MKKIGDFGMDGVARFFLDRFSTFVVPAVIGLATVAALFFSISQYQAQEGNPLDIRIVKEDSYQNLTPVQALKRLVNAPVVAFQDTHLSEEPFWFLMEIPLGVDNAVVEFASRHATEMACWNATTLAILGRANREKVSGAISSARGGYILDSSALGGSSVLCQARFSGPARLSARYWKGADFSSAVRTFQRDSGLIDGGLGVLALFVFITAIINREGIYIVFAVWLFGNLRLAALSAGWDTEWLGYRIVPDWLPKVREITMSIYYVLTVALFERIFSYDLKRVGYRALLRWNQWSCLPMLGIVVLPYAQYLPVMWLMAGIACSIGVIHLTRIIFMTRSRVAIWFGLALLIVLLSAFSEVIAAALGQRGLVNVANSVTGALFSSLMAALAIAQQMRDERMERRRAEAALRSTYQEIPIGLFTLDRAGGIVRANPTLGEMLGDELHDGTHAWEDYFGSKIWHRLAEAVRSGSAVEMELCNLHAANADKWYLMRAKQVGEQIEGSLQDISDRVRAIDKLKFLADHDPLTGVLNRRGIEKVLVEAIAARSADNHYSLAYLDLDRFKLINDMYGHATGDEVLRQICKRVAPELIDGDFLGRVGGDEFVILFRRAALKEAADACRRVIEAIESRPFLIENKAFRVGGCVGLVDVRPDLGIADMIAGADQACREAKKGSGGRLVVYENNSPAFLEREQELRILKRFGVDAPPDGLFLVMQPIMSLHTPFDSLNFEVLLRMYRPDNSVETAWRIITTAEKNGRIAQIDRWVLQHVLEWIDIHFDALARTRFVSVNLSGGSLNDERFIADAYSMVAAHPRSAGRICFEITESVAVSDIDNTLRFVNRVRDFGAKVALDDFGVGYTSFSYLNSLSADVLKIDGSLVKAALAHPANMSIIEAIANLSSNLGMSSIAEWAEDLETIKAMQEVGIDYVQSYALARPQMPEGILAAKSSADFIEDPLIEAYVRKFLAGGAGDLRIQMGGRGKQDLH